jgi:hypothetical protein
MSPNDCSNQFLTYFLTNFGADLSISFLISIYFTGGSGEDFSSVIYGPKFESKLDYGLISKTCALIRLELIPSGILNLLISTKPTNFALLIVFSDRYFFNCSL